MMDPLTLTPSQRETIALALSEALTYVDESGGNDDESSTALRALLENAERIVEGRS